MAFATRAVANRHYLRPVISHARADTGHCKDSGARDGCRGTGAAVSEQQWLKGPAGGSLFAAIDFVPSIAEDCYIFAVFYRFPHHRFFDVPGPICANFATRRGVS